VGDDWSSTLASLDAYDPHRVFGNAFLNTFMPWRVTAWRGGQVLLTSRVGMEGKAGSEIYSRQAPREPPPRLIRQLEL
jgi:hypothetical protein